MPNHDVVRGYGDIVLKFNELSTALDGSSQLRTADDLPLGKTAAGTCHLGCWLGLSTMLITVVK